MNARQPFLVERRMRFMPCTVEPSDSVAHARALLAEQGIKHLPVMLKERLVGIISVHDLTWSGRHSRLARSLEMHPDRVSVSSVMTTEVRTLKPSDNLSCAAHLMQRKHISALPVMEEGRLAGIISRSELLAALASVRAKARSNKRMPHSVARDRAAARRSSQRRRLPSSHSFEAQV
jgi:CBS domain-containing protein